MTPSLAVGIDLGTTNCVVAHCELDEGQSRLRLIPNLRQDVRTRSAVYFADDHVLIGQAAMSAAEQSPERLAHAFRRNVGTASSAREIAGSRIPGEVIQAQLMSGLMAERASHFQTADAAVVLAVPACFDLRRRNALWRCAMMAGLHVLDLINDPTAAAITLADELGYFSSQGDELACRLVLVYDLGGGTFDASLIELSPGSVRTLATRGESNLGGNDFDDRLAEAVAQSFLNHTGIDPQELPERRRALREAVEQAKCALTEQDKVKVEVVLPEGTPKVTISRARFEELTQDLLQHTATLCREAIKAAGKTPQEIDDVLLIGQATRMPMVARMLAKLTGREPRTDLRENDCVARGAALYGAHRLAFAAGPSGAEGLNLVEVRSHGLGIDQNQPSAAKRENRILISRDAPLPSRDEVELVTQSDDQRWITVQVLEGESLDPAECTLVGQATIGGLPPGLPQGWPITLTLTSELSSRFHLSANVSGDPASLTVKWDDHPDIAEADAHRWREIIVTGGGLVQLAALLDDSDRANQDTVQNAGPTDASPDENSLPPQVDADNLIPSPTSALPPGGGLTPMSALPPGSGLPPGGGLLPGGATPPAGTYPPGVPLPPSPGLTPAAGNPTGYPAAHSAGEGSDLDNLLAEELAREAGQGGGSPGGYPGARHDAPYSHAPPAQTPSVHTPPSHAPPFDAGPPTQRSAGSSEMNPAWQKTSSGDKSRKSGSTRKRRSNLPLIVGVAGHLLFAALGLLLGYIILQMLKP
jgi:molecular chaperone DnaK